MQGCCGLGASRAPRETRTGRQEKGVPGAEARREPPTLNAAACYSPTPSRVQYHRRDQALASGFGMGPGVSPGPWPPQIFSYTVGNNVPPACGGLGTGQRTRICRCFVLWPDNAHCRLVPFAGGRCGPTARGWNVSVAFRPLVPVGSTPRGASTSGLSNTCSTCGLQALRGASRNPNLGAGFPLRCFQRLSLPNVANRPCRWRDNRHTRGPSTQVLSYYGQASSGFQRAQRIETKLSHDVLNPARVPL